ncbi:MAG: site-2 protease family protein [Pirellulaceae bacterium]|nr:site-2 protease family protein [Pirellulaceae bacterium]
MTGSLRLGRFGGIDVRIHWTFFLLLAWVAGTPIVAGASLSVAAMNLLLIVAVFSCILAHEYGHAFAARFYGIGTKDITLLPIGGVARLREIPEEPHKELVVAIAGPLVNVAIAIAIGLGLFMTGNIPTADTSLESIVGVSQFWQSLLAINVFLVLFNAIPAFPMDGGRVLRAFLAMRTNRVRATDLAATLGQTIAVGFGLLGLFGNPLLILIAVFIYFGARGEAQHVRNATLMGDLPVRAAMIARLSTVSADDPLLTIRDRLLDGMQQDFPVLDDRGALIGMIYRSDAIDAIRKTDHPGTMREVMVPIGRVVVSPSDSLRQVNEKMQKQGVASLPVAIDGRLVGMVTQENIWELLVFRQDDPEFGALVDPNHADPSESGMRHVN